MKLIKISKDRPLNFGLTLRRFQAYGEDAANFFDGQTLCKVIRLGRQYFLLRLCQNQNAVNWHLFPDTSDSELIALAEKQVNHILGLDFDLRRFYAAVSHDPVFAPLINKFHGFRPTLSSDYFEMLVTSISAQQINLAFAFTVRSRLVRQFGKKLSFEKKTYFAFPTPEILAKTDPAKLRELQFTRRKSEYIVGLAQAIESGEINLQNLAYLSESEIYNQLTALKGIGRWTVDWFLARGLGWPQAFPAGDLAVRKAVQKCYFNSQKIDEEEIREHAKKWGDNANLACHYLLAGLTITDK
ncbi:MAG: DNA-3-methyladenine glycosylase 2 family protein [Calditrichaeota bacterium]|nr:MAG: DNA-3-methyladenine glycosylase 2 family protein [Calditrichota bacterium]